MEIGREFLSYEELESAINAYQDAHFVRLYKRDTRTIQSAKKRATRKEFNARIVYSGIKYTCVHGGKMFVSHTTGLRPNTKTMKLECPFMIRVTSSEDGQKLVVREMITEHNHAINETLYLGYRAPSIKIKQPVPEEFTDPTPETESELDLEAYFSSCSQHVPSPAKKLKTSEKRSEASPVMDRWCGRVAVVTGASSGIGASVAKAFVGLGMHVIGCARTLEPIQTLAKELADEKGSLTSVRCDVTKEEDVKALFKRIKTDPKLGTVHAIVNSAGVGHEAPLLSAETSQWRNMLDVNVLGVLTCTREAVRLMEETDVDDGHIFLLNSMAGHRVLANKNGHFYTATKHMVTALTEGIRNELREKKTHTRVTAISPGVVETDFFNRMYNDPSRAQQFLSSTKFLQDKDVADAVVYALTAPPHVQVHDIQMRSTEQIP